MARSGTERARCCKFPVSGLANIAARSKDAGFVYHKPGRHPLTVGPPPAGAGRHEAGQDAERKTAGKDWRESGLALTTTIGTPIEPRNPNPHFYRLLDRTGLRHVRFHGLRRSCVIYVEVTRHAQRSPTDNLGFLFEN